jgi:hypothetical protein
MVTREDPETRSDGAGSTGALDRPAPPEGTTRTFRIAAAAATVAVCTAALLLSTSWLEAEQKVVVSVLFAVAASATALASCLSAAWLTSGRTRRFWLIFAAAAMLTMGSSSWFYYQVFTDEVPFPSVSDFCWIIAGLVAAAGLLGLA